MAKLTDEVTQITSYNSVFVESNSLTSPPSDLMSMNSHVARTKGIVKADRPIFPSVFVFEEHNAWQSSAKLKNASHGWPFQDCTKAWDWDYVFGQTVACVSLVLTSTICMQSHCRISP
jgi:hypothetical protein